MQENQSQMAKLVQLLNEWEIQLLVLFSFALQVFLFFTGGLRRFTTSKIARLLIWMAYLGADLVAVFALGFLSRQEDSTTGKDTLTGTHQLDFFWAPFLLIHLGGQDTITAFAIEDNNLWLRHLLNLVVQGTLALYIFWKSTSSLSMQLIVPSILLFVTGTIKYGERIWALWCGSLGSLNNLDSSTVFDYYRRPIGRDACYSDIISRALYSTPGVRDVFADYGVYHSDLDLKMEDHTVHPDKLPKLLEIELGLVYDDIYTKTTVIRTRCGLILRCISDIFFVAAFVLFFVSNKQRYKSVDTAITYALFIGGFSLEVCAIFITMMSPWTWAWLKRREGSGLCRFLLSINVGWQRKRLLWSDSMGQYSLLNYLGHNDQLQSGLWKRCVMAAIRKVVNLVCGIKQKLWISKLLDTKFVEADKEIMGCVVQSVVQYSSTESSMRRQFPTVQFSTVGPLLRRILQPRQLQPLMLQTRQRLLLLLQLRQVLRQVQQLPRLRQVQQRQEQHLLQLQKQLQLLLQEEEVEQPQLLQEEEVEQPQLLQPEQRLSSLAQPLWGFAGVIIGLHTYTELLLSRYSCTSDVSARVSRTISNYMSYLLVTHPEMLPIKQSQLPLLLETSVTAVNLGNNSGRDDVIQRHATAIFSRLGFKGPFPEICTEAHLLEIQEAWIGLLIYAAGKSRPEAHAAQLARGGGLLTFVWLLMAHHLLGDVHKRIELADIFHVEEEFDY